MSNVAFLRNYIYRTNIRSCLLFFLLTISVFTHPPFSWCDYTDLRTRRRDTCYYVGIVTKKVHIRSANSYLSTRYYLGFGTILISGRVRMGFGGLFYGKDTYNWHVKRCNYLSLRLMIWSVTRGTKS